MILITNIEATEVPGNSRELYSRLAVHDLLEGSEVIQGVCFRRPDGSTINIGTSKQAQEVIGIQYEAWKNMEKELHHAGSELNSLRKEQAYFRGMGFWRRLKWVFKL